MTTPSTADIRNWARANGFTVADRGRLSPEVLAAYSAAHGDGASGSTPAGQSAAALKGTPGRAAGTRTGRAAKKTAKSPGRKTAAKKGATKAAPRAAKSAVPQQATAPESKTPPAVPPVVGSSEPATPAAAGLAASPDRTQTGGLGTPSSAAKAVAESAARPTVRSAAQPASASSTTDKLEQVVDELQAQVRALLTRIERLESEPRRGGLFGRRRQG